jgi:hypothetical protein
VGPLWIYLLLVNDATAGSALTVLMCRAGRELTVSLILSVHAMTCNYGMQAGRCCKLHMHVSWQALLHAQHLEQASRSRLLFCGRQDQGYAEHC